MKSRLVISSAVRTALKNHEPVVALESTILTHGLPRPTNLEVAQRCEAAVKSSGSVPATIFLYKGKIHIGKEFEIMSLMKYLKVQVRKNYSNYVSATMPLKSRGETSPKFCLALAGAARQLLVLYWQLTWLASISWLQEDLAAFTAAPKFRSTFLPICLSSDERLWR